MGRFVIPDRAKLHNSYLLFVFEDTPIGLCALKSLVKVPARFKRDGICSESEFVDAVFRYIGVSDRQLSVEGN